MNLASEPFDRVDWSEFNRREKRLVTGTYVLLVSGIVASALWIRANLAAPTFLGVISMPILIVVAGAAINVLLAWTIEAQPGPRISSKVSMRAYVAMSCLILASSLVAYVTLDGVLAFRVFVALLIGVPGQIALSAVVKLVDYLAIAVRRGRLPEK